MYHNRRERNIYTGKTLYYNNYYCRSRILSSTTLIKSERPFASTTQLYYYDIIIVLCGTNNMISADEQMYNNMSQ